MNQPAKAMRSRHISHAYIALHKTRVRSYIWIMLMTGTA